MSFSIQEFWLQKAGNSPEEYEDAFACEASAGRFAIADGATESSFAKSWAQSLVEKFVSDSPLGSPLSARKLKRWLFHPQHQWSKAIDWDKLPWYAEEKSRAGAFSSLLGLEFAEGDDTTKYWHAFAVGDSCLFHVRGDVLLCAFPIERSEEFGSTPFLLSSNPKSNRRIGDELRYIEGSYESEDTFFLATDALAHWCFVQCEMDKQPWERLLNIYEPEEFEAFVARLREEGEMRNDDLTLLTIQCYT